jgi:hypothetical protein
VVGAGPAPPSPRGGGGRPDLAGGEVGPDPRRGRRSCRVPGSGCVGWMVGVWLLVVGGRIRSGAAGPPAWLGGPHPRRTPPAAARLIAARPGVPHAAGRAVVNAARWPARYDEIRLDGVLDGRWSQWFEGLRIDHQGGETLLSGTLPDQPALHGILDRVRDLGLSITALRRIPTGKKQESKDETRPCPVTQTQAGTSVAGGSRCWATRPQHRSSEDARPLPRSDLAR